MSRAAESTVSIRTPGSLSRISSTAELARTRRAVVVAGVVEERADNSDAHEVHDSLGELVDVGCVALQQTSELFRAAGSFVHGAPE